MVNPWKSYSIIFAVLLVVAILAFFQSSADLQEKKREVLILADRVNTLEDENQELLYKVEKLENAFASDDEFAPERPGEYGTTDQIYASIENESEDVFVTPVPAPLNLQKSTRGIQTIKDGEKIIVYDVLVQNKSPIPRVVDVYLLRYDAQGNPKTSYYQTSEVIQKGSELHVYFYDQVRYGYNYDVEILLCGSEYEILKSCGASDAWDAETIT